MKRVHVSNIPIHAFVEGWVEVPDDTTKENLNEAISKALLDKGYDSLSSPESEELDAEVVKNGWEFDIVGA